MALGESFQIRKFEPMTRKEIVQQGEMAMTPPTAPA